jgi:hypothetical protein
VLVVALVHQGAHADDYGDYDDATAALIIIAHRSWSVFCVLASKVLFIFTIK